MKLNKVHHDHLVSMGMPQHLVEAALNKGLDWNAIAALILKYGLPIAIQIIQDLLGIPATPVVPTPAV